jgi:hypothetical protein
MTTYIILLRSMTPGCVAKMPRENMRGGEPGYTFEFR